MKRIILLAALLLASSACATTTEAPSTNAPTQPSNTTTTATPKPATMNAADSDAAVKEREIWETIKKKDSAAFAALLADDFIYVTEDGVHDKAATVEGVKPLDITDMTFSDWKTVTLDKDAMVVTYIINLKGTSGGQPIPAAPVRGGSVWVNRGGKWVGVFHQDTTVEPPPADVAANKPPAATTATTPATEAKPAVPVADDPIAREKQIWEAIKNRDYDRFASFLADDQIEVFAWGVNDKAGSVEGVRQVDLSKATLSEFKTMKLSDSAVVVTYMVKGPTPPFTKGGERSSSIWVNRGGKWLVVYHQGTNIAPALKSK
jgi:hypothetical protein